MSTESNRIPDRNSIEYTEQLLAYMSDRLEVLKLLKAIGRSQSEASLSSEMNTTMSLLARKQTLLDRLVTIGSEMEPYMSDDPEQRIWATPERRQECQKIADQGNALLHEALQQDQSLINEMTARRDAIAAQLQDGKDSILAHSAYTADSLLNESQLDINDA